MTPRRYWSISRPVESDESCANGETEDDVNRLISMLGACLLVACAFAPASAADMAAAKQNYDTFCVKCHGPGGKGDGPAAATDRKSTRLNSRPVESSYAVFCLK